MSNAHLSPHFRYGLILTITLILCAYIILRQTAITADAYVTFRVVDNAVHGYGLRWNIAERVQVYTHPLWMLLHIPLYAIWNDIFHITIGLSLFFTLAALGLVAYTFHTSALAMIALWIIPLCISVSFTDSSVLGLENPLSHFLFAFFGWVLLRFQGRYFWFWITFSFALILFNRIDNGLICFPAMMWVVMTRFCSLKIGQCLLGMMPIMGWLIFSLFYYGFLFPNTRYAKMPSLLLDKDVLSQGVHYLMNLIVMDITSAEFIAIAVILVPLAYRYQKSLIRPEMFFISVGILLQVFYTIWIGGTYISGRFWSLPIFASIWLVYGIWGPVFKIRQSIIVMIVLMVVAFLYPDERTIRQACPVCFDGGIVRKWYSVKLVGYEGRLQGHEAPEAGHNPVPGISVSPGVGIPGFIVGPNITIINPLGFTDPLLARLPNSGVPMSRSVLGHLWREIPEGYIHARENGSLEMMDPSLATYYAKLRFIITGDLWSLERVAEIVRFNLGEYDYLRDHYINTHITTPNT